MSGKRGGGGPPVSLFSFQDIITSIAGILLLMVLLFAINLAVSSEPVGPPEDAEQTTETVYPDRQPEVDRLIAGRAALQLRQITGIRIAHGKDEIDAQTAALSNQVGQSLHDYASVTARLADVQEAISNVVAQIERNEGKDVVNILPGEGAKAPIIVECSGSRIRCGRLQGTAKPVVFTGSQKEGSLVQHVRSGGFDPSREYFLFMVKPSAIAYFESLRDRVRDLRYEVGWDALAENESIGFEESGE